MSAQAAVKQAVYSLLAANAGVIAAVAKSPLAGSPAEPAIYDNVPQSATPEDAAQFPYLVIGESTAIEFDTDDINGQETTLTLHVWDRYRGRKRVNAALDAIYTALHDVNLSVSGQVAVLCLWVFSQVFEEDGPTTQHGVTRFRIVTMES